MSDFIVNLIKYSGIVSLIPALIYFFDLLMRKLIKKDELVLQSDLQSKLEIQKSSLIEDIETHKSNLSERIVGLTAQYSREIESLKNELQQKNIMLEIAYSGIYKQRLDSLKELYVILLKFQNALRENNKKLGEVTQTIENCKSILKDFEEKFYVNAIFLPEHLDDKIRLLISKMHNSIYKQDQDKQITRLESAGSFELAELILKKLHEQEDQIHKIRYELCSSIRNIIGSNYIDDHK